MNDKNVLTNLEDDLIELENQLSCPIGDFGIEVGKKMNESNFNMILNSINFLNIPSKSKVLEIGHGNCAHLEELFKVAKNTEYFGLEISETMWQEAQIINSNRKGVFKLYNGVDIPFEDNYFDRILAVNSIYFWENPEKLLSEIERTLIPDGFCVITFGHKKFLEKLPYTKNKFQIYDKEMIEKLIKNINFKIYEVIDIIDENPSQIVEIKERKYTMVKLQKF